MPLPQALIAALETACNRYLALDDETLAKLSAFEGKIIAVEILGINQTLFLFPAVDGVMVLSDFDGEADAIISGTPLALTKLGLAEDAAPLLFSGEVRISGDTRLGHQFKKVLQSMQIDWEEHLSHYIGDMAARQLGNLVRDMSQWWQRNARSTQQDVGDYLQEESHLVVSKPEIHRYVCQVDELRDAMERLEARLGNIK